MTDLLSSPPATAPAVAVPGVRSASPAELDLYLRDFEALEVFERDAERDLEQAEASPLWTPTPYEQLYLPGLRLAGIEDKQLVTLQNTADLHLHTHYSDGDDLDAVLEHAQRARLDAIAITDHDVIEGALEARRRVHERRLKVAVVPGVEVSSADGHIGALFVTRRVPAGLPAAETVRLIHEQGGIAIAHHPYAPRLIEALLGVKLGCRDLVHEVDFDAIECTNAVPGYGRRYNLAAHEALCARRVRVAMSGGSDAHVATLVGKGRTYFGGNHGVVSLKTSLQHGFALGAEGYWTTREKLAYRWHLVRAVVRNLLRRHASVN